MRPYVVLFLLSACVDHATPPPRAAIDEWDVAQRNTAWEFLGVGYVANKSPVPERQALADQRAKVEQHRNFANYAIVLVRRCREFPAQAEDAGEAVVVEALNRALDAVTNYERRDDILIGETYALAKAEVAKLAKQIASDATLEQTLRSCLGEKAADVAAELAPPKLPKT